MSMVEFQSKHEVAKTTTQNPVIGEFQNLTPTTLASMESLSMPEVHQVVFLADFGCSKCQERVAEIMSKMTGEMQSVVVSVRKEEVTLTCTNPKFNVVSATKIGTLCNRRSSSTRLALIIKLFFSARS